MGDTSNKTIKIENQANKVTPKTQDAHNRVVTGVKIGAYLLALLVFLIFADPNHTIFGPKTAAKFPDFVAFLFFLIVFAGTIWLMVFVVKEINNCLLQKHNKKTYALFLILMLVPLVATTATFCWYSYFFDYPIDGESLNVGPLGTCNILFFCFLLVSMVVVFAFSLILYLKGKDSVKHALFFSLINMFVELFFINFYYVVSTRGWITIVYLMLIPLCVDMFSYWGGRRFGKHKLAPQVSPNKTWEGFAIGGSSALLISVAFGVLLSIAIWVNMGQLGSSQAATAAYNIYGYQFYHYDPQSYLVQWELPKSYNILFDHGVWWAAYLPLTVAMIFASLGGDLLFSKAKRIVKTKDFGDLLKGHGGILDRIDSQVAVFMVYCVFSIFICVCVAGLGTNSSLVSSHYLDLWGQVPA